MKLSDRPDGYGYFYGTYKMVIVNVISTSLLRTAVLPAGIVTGHDDSDARVAPFTCFIEDDPIGTDYKSFMEATDAAMKYIDKKPWIGIK